MIKKEEIVIRDAEMNDAVPVTALLKRLGLVMPDQEQSTPHWERLWVLNPYYKTFNEKPYIGWVMEYEGKLVGFFGCFPRLYFLNGEPFRLSIPTQWGIEGAFRPYKNLLCEKFFNENPIKTKFVTTAINATGKIFERYHSIRIPTDLITDVYLVPLKIDRLAMARISSMVKKPFIFKPFRPFLQLLSLPWRWHYSLLKRSRFISEISVAEFSDDFNTFWKTFLKNSKGIFADRSTENVKWFYSGGFRKLENKIFVYRENNEIKGYISIIKEPVKNSDLERYKIVDLIALSKEINNELIKFVTGYCYDKNADVLEIHLPGFISRKDIPVFTLKRNLPVCPFYYHSNDREINAHLNDKALWHISSYDGDTSVF